MRTRKLERKESQELESIYIKREKGNRIKKANRESRREG
jgi:hypothetical protein